MALADRKWCLGCDTLDSVSLIPKYCSSWEVLVSHLQGYRLGLKKGKKKCLKTVVLDMVGRSACHCRNAQP